MDNEQFDIVNVIARSFIITKELGFPYLQTLRTLIVDT